MASENVVRRIEIVGTSRGLGEVEDKLRAVGSATDDLAKATEENAKVTETASRRQISAAGAYDRLRGQIDQQYRAQRQLERGQQTLDRAMQQGLATQAEYDRAMKQLRERYLHAAAANDNFRAANDNAAKSVSVSTRLIDRLKQSVSQLVLAYASFQGLKAFGGMADEWSDMQSKVGAAVRDMEAAPRLMQRIVDIANASYSPLSQTVEVYSRNAAVFRDLGGSAADAADFTEALNHALVLTATRGQHAEAVQNALSKAMAVGKLQGLGLQTVMAHGGEVAQALAEELGTTQNSLYKLAAEGKITSDVIANALIKRLDDLRERAGEMPATIGDAFVRIGTNLTALIGRMSSATGGSGMLAEALIWVADNLDKIAKAALVAGVALFTAFSPALLSSMAFGMGYLGAAGVAALNAIRVAVMANPLGALATALVTLTAGLYLFRDEIFDVIGIDVIFEIQKAANRIIGLFLGAYAAVTDAWGNLPTFFSAIGKEAWNNLVSEFEKPALTINGRTIIPGLDLSGLKTQLTEEEKKARDRAKVTFDTEFLKDYIDLLPEITAGGKTAAEAAEELRRKLELAGGAANEDYTKMVDAAQRRIDQMREEIGLVGKSGIEADALRFKYDLLAKAKEQNIKLGPDEKAKIDELTDAYRRAATELAALEALKQIEFDLSIMGLSEGDQKIMSALRQMGLDADSAYGQMVAGALRYRDVQQDLQDELKAVKDVGRDAFMSILDLLYESGDAGEKLISIFAGIGKQFARLGMERLWKSISGEGGSIFDGISGSAKASFSPVQTAQVGREIGNAIAPSISTSLNDNLQSYAAAIRKIESGSYQGNYGAVGPMVQKGSYAGDHAYGAYQVMGKNIAAWTKEATGTALTTQQFPNDRAAQDKVFFTKFGQSLDKFGNFADATSVWFSGRPLNRAGNASDGYNTVPQYVQKAEGALAGFNPGVLKSGVSAGVVDASRKMAHMPEMAGNGPGGFAPTQGGGGNLQNMLGIGGAAFGAFAGGLQSGDPISGALGGAMSGFGAAPALAAMGIAAPIGIIGGAIIGLIGGLIGQAKKRREELAKAREELESQMGAITKLIADSTGNFMGAIEQTLLDRLDEFSKAIKLAEKAQNYELTQQLSDARVSFIDRTITKWRASFEATLSSLTAGTGFDGEFLAGVDAVEKMREALVGFVNDAKLMSQSSEDIHKELEARQQSFWKKNEPLHEYKETITIGYNENQMSRANELVDGYLDLAKQVMDHGVQAFKQSGEQLYETLTELKSAAEEAGLAIDEMGKVTRAAANDNTDYSGAIAQAMEAAQRAALVMLSGAEEFTAVEKAVQKMHGAASLLPEVLQDLGMSAEDAASAIENELITALDKLRHSVRLDIQRSLNELADVGFLNDFADAQSAYQTRLKDLAAAGLPANLAIEELGLRMRKIATDAELTDDQLRRLAGVFPEIGGAILGALGMAGGNPGSALADAKSALEEAKANLRSAYEDEKRAIEQVISRHQALTKSLRSFLDDLRLDSGLSPLDPFERLQEAQKQFQETAAKALTGDEEALGKLEAVSRAYLTEAKAWWGTSTQYFEVFKDVEAIVAQALTVSEGQLSEAERQLAALESQIKGLVDLDKSVKSVEDAISDLMKAEADYEAAKIANDDYQNHLFEQMLALMAEQRDALGDVAASMAYLNANMDVMNAISAGQDFGTGSTDIGVLANAHWQQHGQFENREVGLGQQSRGAKYLANNPDVLAGIRSGQTFGTNSTDYDVLAKAHWDLHGQFENRIKGYANGGNHFGGLRIVGERGPELEATGPSRIWTAHQTQAFMRGGNDNNAVVTELRSVKVEVVGVKAQLAAIKDEVARNTQTTAAGAQGQIAATGQTTQAVNRQAEESRRAQYRRAG